MVSLRWILNWFGPFPGSQPKTAHLFRRVVTESSFQVGGSGRRSSVDLAWKKFLSRSGLDKGFPLAEWEWSQQRHV